MKLFKTAFTCAAFGALGLFAACSSSTPAIPANFASQVIAATTTACAFAPTAESVASIWASSGTMQNVTAVTNAICSSLAASTAGKVGASRLGVGETVTFTVNGVTVTGNVVAK